MTDSPEQLGQVIKEGERQIDLELREQIRQNPEVLLNQLRRLDLLIKLHQINEETSQLSFFDAYNQSQLNDYNAMTTASEQVSKRYLSDLFYKAGLDQPQKAKVYSKNLDGGFIPSVIKLPFDENGQLLFASDTVSILVYREDISQFYPKPIDEIDRIEFIDEE